MHAHHEQDSRHRPLTLIAVASGVAIMAALAGGAVFGSRASAATTVEASVNAAVNVAAGGNEPLTQAAAGAAEVAKSAGLKAAIAGAWQVAWEKSWPFIRDSVVRFFSLIGQAWRSMLKSAPAGTDLNAAASTNASVNATP